MKVSVCCQAPVDEDIMVCSDCHEQLGDEDLEEESDNQYQNLDNNDVAFQLQPGNIRKEL